MNTEVTPRERQVLKLIAAENSSKEIANRLFLSDHTVQSHRKNLMRKLDVKNTAGLIRRGFELGYLNVDRKRNARYNINFPTNSFSLVRTEQNAL